MKAICMKTKSTKCPSIKTVGAPKKVAGDQYRLELFVTGGTSKSLHAINNIKRICEKYLKGRYQLEVIDIYQQPALAKKEQIIAVPTLIKKLPSPLRRLIGAMTDNDRILLGLDVKLAYDA